LLEPCAAAVSAAIPVHRSKARSAETNGLHVLRDADGRSATARRYRDVVLALAGDCGGEAQLNESTKILIRQAAGLTVQLETMQSAIARGESVNVEQLTRASNSLSRMLDTLRRPVEVAR
jgi:hypothetical protein